MRCSRATSALTPSRRRVLRRWHRDVHCGSHVGACVGAMAPFRAVLTAMTPIATVIDAAAVQGLSNLSRPRPAAVRHAAVARVLSEGFARQRRVQRGSANFCGVGIVQTTGFCSGPGPDCVVGDGCVPAGRWRSHTGCSVGVSPAVFATTGVHTGVSRR